MLAMTLAILQLILSGSRPVPVRDPLVFGLFLASIEEGARAFTPIRLLPFDHPDAFNHEFPNALVNHTSEVEALVALGEHAGLKLRTTLQRYPQPPVETWPYPEFALPPLDCMRSAKVERVTTEAVLPGLRAVITVAGAPLVFIVDTRGLTLKERRMQRVTAMGLDLTRAQFLELLAASVPAVGRSNGCMAFIFPGSWVSSGVDDNERQRAMAPGAGIGSLSSANRLRSPVMKSGSDVRINVAHVNKVPHRHPRWEF